MIGKWEAQTFMGTMIVNRAFSLQHFGQNIQEWTK